MTCRHCGQVIHRNPRDPDQWVHANLRVKCDGTKCKRRKERSGTPRQELTTAHVTR